jgi:ribonuclease P protein component
VETLLQKQKRGREAAFENEPARTLPASAILCQSRLDQGVRCMYAGGPSVFNLIKKGRLNEKNLPTSQQAQAAHARLSQADAHTGRTRGPAPPPRQGTRAARRLSGRSGTALEREARLRASRDLQGVLDHGSSVVAPDLVLYYSARAGEGHSRFGFVVSRRIGGAVVRNRARRLLREAAWALAPQLGAPVDIVVVARGPIRSRRFDSVAATLRDCAVRAGLIPD